MFRNISIFLQLTQVEDSNNYFDEDGFVYSPNNTKASKNMYFRCKYTNSLKCRARVIVDEDNFGNAKLTQKHCHLPSDVKLCKTKMDKKVDKICRDRKYITARAVYLLARNDTPADEVDNAPDRQSLSVRVHRRKKEFEPKLPHSFEEFDEFINDEKYKQRYTINPQIHHFILIAQNIIGAGFRIKTIFLRAVQLNFIFEVIDIHIDRCC